MKFQLSRQFKRGRSDSVPVTNQSGLWPGTQSPSPFRLPPAGAQSPVPTGTVCGLETRTSAATYPSKRRFSRRFEDCCIDHPSKHTQQAVGSTRTDPYPFLQRSPQPRSTLRAYPAVNCRRQCHRTAARSPETIRKKAPSARVRCKQSRLKLIIPLRSPTRSPVGVRTATRGIASVQP